MNKIVDLRTNTLKLFFSDGEADAETFYAIIGSIDFNAVAQAIIANASDVLEYSLVDRSEGGLSYCGPKLFDSRAALLYSRIEVESESAFRTMYVSELWVTEEMDSVAVRCVQSGSADEKCICSFRTVKARGAGNILKQMDVNISEFIKALCELEDEYTSENMPIYEI